MVLRALYLLHDPHVKFKNVAAHLLHKGVARLGFQNGAKTVVSWHIHVRHTYPPPPRKMY